jgi:hypothetical protein
MEMKRTSKVLATILALVLIVCAMLCVVAFAENEAPSLGYANVVYGDRISLAFTVENAGDGTVGIAVYKNAEDETPMYVSFDKKVNNNVEYYETFGIAAKDIDTVYYVAVATKDADGNVTNLSAPAAYSVAQYATDSLAKEDITDAQKAVYQAILNYNKAADAVITVAAN